MSAVFPFSYEQTYSLIIRFKCWEKWLTVCNITQLCWLLSTHFCSESTKLELTQPRIESLFANGLVLIVVKTILRKGLLENSRLSLLYHVFSTWPYFGWICNALVFPGDTEVPYGTLYGPLDGTSIQNTPASTAFVWPRKKPWIFKKTVKTAAPWQPATLLPSLPKLHTSEEKWPKPPQNISVHCLP